LLLQRIAQCGASTHAWVRDMKVDATQAQRWLFVLPSIPILARRDDSIPPLVSSKSLKRCGQVGNLRPLLIGLPVARATLEQRLRSLRLAAMWGRMASCGGLATRLPVICTAAASQGPIANRPQDAILPHILQVAPLLCRAPYATYFLITDVSQATDSAGRITWRTHSCLQASSSYPLA